MIRGLGLDLCEISRMEKMLKDSRFMDRYFTAQEAAYVRSRGAGAARTLAGLFASREALGKALGGGDRPPSAWPEPYSDVAAHPPFGYVRRTECHGLSPYDWKWALDFAESEL